MGLASNMVMKNKLAANSLILWLLKSFHNVPRALGAGVLRSCSHWNWLHHLALWKAITFKTQGCLSTLKVAK